MEASFKTFRKKDNILAEFPSLELLVLLVQAKRTITKTFPHPLIHFALFYTFEK